MMEQGSLTVRRSTDSSGASVVSVTFSPGGGGTPYPLADGLPFEDGDAITISPTCVCCTLETNVSPGGPQESGGAQHSPTRPAAAQTRPAQQQRGGQQQGGKSSHS